ncbi:AAA family ATPase [Daejeonella sp.]|uniref:ATP-dependent dethiobiotin synthetase BioD n=1 Tax=Daejeonella sp. TaxID=2805397 RepID=UPI0025BBDACA|nr:AAA family ATPase [Daejeonella sp.]
MQLIKRNNHRIIKKFDAEVVLVSKIYLGSINHTLLSVELLKSRNIPVRKLIFSGEWNSEDMIKAKSELEILRVPFFDELSKESIRKFVRKFNF